VTTDAPRGTRVRPYAVTGGRTAPRHHLAVETLVSAPGHDPGLAETLAPEARALYEQIGEPVSVAELTARLTIPLHVTRVLLSDLADEGAVVVHPTVRPHRCDGDVLRRVLDGLERLPA
jgi:hypothetical protein